MKSIISIISFSMLSLLSWGQLVINEGTNRNFSLVYDEDAEASDWVEILNTSADSLDLFGYAINDSAGTNNAFVFNHYWIQPQEHLIVFLSGKDRHYSTPFQEVLLANDFIPQNGINTHNFTTPFNWDGSSDLIINTCSYSNTGYTVNSIFNQTYTPYNSTVAAFQDGGDGICQATTGEVHNVRPVLQLNGLTIGTNDYLNGNTDYPAPYGNWYWASRHQMLITAAELVAAGLTPGPINSLAFDVASTDPTLYTYFDISMRQVIMSEMTNFFVGNQGQYFHTNFQCSTAGETIYLFQPDGTQIHSLTLNATEFDVTVGGLPNGSGNYNFLSLASPGATNDSATAVVGQAIAPQLSLPGGVYTTLQQISIFDLNNPSAEIHYTTDGSEPTLNSTLYNGLPIMIFQSTVVRARAFIIGKLPSDITSSSYLINVNHTTPIVSLMISPDHLFSADGIFTNWWLDGERFVQMEYFDSTLAHNFVFDRDCSIQVDGGAGGSRSNPQTSFRLEMAKSIFDANPVLLPLIPQQPNRAKYSKLYFRNGSNQYLNLPYKDAAQTTMMTGKSHGYYSTMRPASVYINGQYWGLYEMREKLDEEYFKVQDGTSKSSMDILTMSYWYGSVLRATAGDVNNYWDSYNQILTLNPTDANYISQIDSLYDMEYLSDYIIGETWMGNTDWPYNNIKIYRGDSTQYRWRFATIDLELSLQPNGWTDCNTNGLEHAMNNGEGNPYIRAWWQSLNNNTYRNYFINRYADLMNTAYMPERLLAVENTFFNLWTPEMPNEYQRWADPWNVSGWMNDYYNRHLQFQNELVCKANTVRSQVETTMSCGPQKNVVFNIEPAQAGLIHLNTITLEDSTWSGIYYTQVPIHLNAQALPGYLFSHWTTENGEIVDTLQAAFTTSLNNDSISFTAHFVVDPNAQVENISLNETRLYPNPGNSWINIENKFGLQKVEIWNSNGQKIMDRKYTAHTQKAVIFSDNFESGLYLIQTTDSRGNQETKRWMKAN
jgi:hypothetical protein